jgi:hypothetical protein
MRHEDVHGVSGTGDHLADVFESSDGTTIVRWLGKDGSTNVYQGVKNVTNVHGHGGKTEIEWLWEQEADTDPMEAVFDKKITEASNEARTRANGSTAPTGPSGPTAIKEEADKEAEAEEIADALVEEAAETVERVGKKLAEKLQAKVAESVAENAQAEAETAEE